MTAERMANIEEAIQTALEPAKLEIQDDSHLHVGHTGAGKGGHFTVFVVSDKFTGLMPIKRHKLIYAAVDHMMPDEIHALSIKSLSPEEFEKLN